MAGIINLAQPTNRVTGHINRSGRIDCETAMRKAAKLQVFSIDPPHNKSRGSFRAEFAKATRERERDGRELFRFVSRPTARERARNTRGNFEKLGNTSTKDGGKKENAAYLFSLRFDGCDAREVAFRSLAEQFDAPTVTERGLYSRRTSRNLDSRESDEDFLNRFQ